MIAAPDRPARRPALSCPSVRRLAGSVADDAAARDAALVSAVAAALREAADRPAGILSVTAFCAADPALAAGGRYAGRVLHERYVEEAGRLGLAALPFMGFAAAMAPRIRQARRLGTIEVWDLAPTPSLGLALARRADEHRPERAGQRGARADERAGRLMDLAGEACAWLTLAVAGVAFGLILHAVLP